MLIADCSIEPETYRPVEHWRANTDCEIESFRTTSDPFPEKLDPFTHVIITGSEETILSDHDWILRTCDFVRKVAGMRMPMLASCFGHQLIVRALSGKQHVRRCPTPEFGWVEVTSSDALAKDPIFRSLPAPFHTYSVHFDEVHPLPDEWERLGSSSRCENAVIRWRGGPVWGLQHHPEIGIEEGEKFYEMVLADAGERRGMVLSGFVPDRRDSLITPALMKAFLAVPSPERP